MKRLIILAALALSGCCNCPPDVHAAYIKGHNDGFQDGIDHVGNGTRSGL